MIPAQAIAADTAGLTATATATIIVVGPNDTAAPVVNLDEDHCADVTQLYTLTRSITDEGAFTYRLMFREKGTENWIVLAEGDGSGNYTGEMGVFDPTMLINTVYEIVLVAEDANGNVGFDMSCVLVDGQMKLGPVVLPRVDLELPEIGPDLSVERIYDSRQTGSGDFGPGWHLPQSQVKPVVTKTLG